LFRAPAAILFFVLAATAWGNEAQIRKVLEPKLPDARIEAVVPAPVPGLWEVRVRTGGGEMQLLYTDGAAGFLFQGRLYDLRNDRNLTEERLRKLNAIRFDILPLDQAVKIQRGNGTRVLVMFSDPYCPACRNFEGQLARIDDITVYVFMYPVIRPENADHSRAVWCSADRPKAWLELAAFERIKIPQASPRCPNPVDEVVQLGRRLGVNSTPTLFLANGERFSGGLAASDLRALLDRVMAEQAAEAPPARAR
jgi:thiol:disulfide interchange protein DsbC